MAFATIPEDSRRKKRNKRNRSLLYSSRTEAVAWTNPKKMRLLKLRSRLQKKKEKIGEAKGEEKGPGAASNMQVESSGAS
jgi:hypothetical protein